MKVGFIGLGTMGASIAMNAIKGQHQLIVHDLNESAATAHIEAGAAWAESPAGVTSDTDVILLSLPGPKEFEAVTLGEGGLLDAVQPGQAILDLTTNSPTVIRRVSAIFADKGVQLLDAPVSGGPAGAKS
ncbi:MAG: NAD(P)-dependent oxidoreductase, partial [Hyphomicrobiaceae bacterium]